MATLWGTHSQTDRQTDKQTDSEKKGERKPGKVVSMKHDEKLYPLGAPVASLGDLQAIAHTGGWVYCPNAGKAILAANLPALTGGEPLKHFTAGGMKVLHPETRAHPRFLTPLKKGWQLVSDIIRQYSDIRPEAASLLNLAALCQRCHNRHDAAMRRAGRLLRRQKECLPGPCGEA